jgi:hypothetical protein
MLARALSPTKDVFLRTSPCMWLTWVGSLTEHEACLSAALRRHYAPPQLQQQQLAVVERGGGVRSLMLLLLLLRGASATGAQCGVAAALKRMAPALSALCKRPRARSHHAGGERTYPKQHRELAVLEWHARELSTGELPEARCVACMAHACRVLSVGGWPHTHPPA